MFEAILDKKLNADRGFIKPKRKPPEELERLKRENLLMTLNFYIQDFIDKQSPENLWTKCYVKIKELILNQNTDTLKEALTKREMEINTPYTDTLITDQITGIETIVPIPDDPIIVDTIPAEYEYLLEIEDHLN